MQQLSVNRRLNVVASHFQPSSHEEHIKFNDVCGIIGVIAHEPVANYLIEGLKIMEPRGYDSAGMVTLKDGKLVTSKFASKEPLIML